MSSNKRHFSSSQRRIEFILTRVSRRIIKRGKGYLSLTQFYDIQGIFREPIFYFGKQSRKFQFYAAKAPIKFYDVRFFLTILICFRGGKGDHLGVIEFKHILGKFWTFCVQLKALHSPHIYKNIIKNERHIFCASLM